MKSFVLIFVALSIALTSGKAVSSSLYGQDGRADIFSRSEQLDHNYSVEWTVNRLTKSINFTATARTSGWVGFGFSESGSMNYADIIIGGVYDNKTSYFTDRHSLRPGLPDVDLSQDWYLTWASESFGLTTLNFFRNFETGDTAGDFDITNTPTYFIWAIGFTDELAHHEQRGAFPVNILEEEQIVTAPPPEETTQPPVETTRPPGSDIFKRTEDFSENYTASWSVDRTNQVISFTLSVRTTGYVGFGISDFGNMTKADLIIGGVFDNKTVYFDDRYSLGHGLPPVDASQDWRLSAASEAFGVTTLIFERDFITNDNAADVPITYRNTYFVWSVGATDDLQYHDEDRRGNFALNVLDSEWTVTDAPPGTTAAPEPPSEVFTRTEAFNGNYTATWVVNTTSQALHVTLSVRTTGYVGFGISENGNMTNADLIIGGVFDNKTVYFDDRFAAGHGVPAIDQEQNWILLGASEGFGITTLVFDRPFVTNDLQDVNIEYKNTYFIWSIGSSDDIAHHAVRGSFALNILQDPNSS